MDTERARGVPRIPLPRGHEHEAWIFDVTPLAWLRRTWPTRLCPYKYSPAGQLVRICMPGNGLVKYASLMRRLTDYVHRDRKAINERFHLTDEWLDDQVAMLLLATALTERDTTFVVYNIEPNGRTVMFLRTRPFLSWHPDSPGRSGE